jgi:hypothetical protein
MKHSTRKLVWHVVRFAERFELPDDARICRKSPLIYTRDYVTESDDESANYLKQLAVMSRRQNSLELEGAWSRIRRAAACRSRAFRGYLLNGDEPASDAEIGRTILFCEPRRATRILQALKEIGLIEQVRCPIFDISRNDVPPKKRRKKPVEQVRGARAQSGQRKSVSRKATGRPEGARTPLRAKRKNERVREERNTNAGIPEGQPSATTNPKESEAGQSHANGPTAGGSALSVHAKRSRPDAVPIGHCLKIRDFDAENFGLQVFEALGLDKRYSVGSREGKSERASFANWLIKAKAQHPPEAWPALRERGVEKARYIAKHGRTAEKPGAVWHTVMGTTEPKAKDGCSGVG